jgi:hypothetical protein
MGAYGSCRSWSVPLTCQVCISTLLSRKCVENGVRRVRDCTAGLQTMGILEGVPLQRERFVFNDLTPCEKEVSHSFVLRALSMQGNEEPD